MNIQNKNRASKQLVYISIISMVMMFAGLTSAYIISMKREDWVRFDLPQALFVSTLLIILSSVSFWLAKKSLRNNNKQQTTIFIGITLLLAIGFVFFQIEGFNQLTEAGLFFTGKGSVVSSSLLVVISFAHLLHVLAGIIVLTVVLFQQLRGKYNSDRMLGFEMGAIFWHFVDILWIFLFLFFYFIR